MRDRKEVTTALMVSRPGSRPMHPTILAQAAPPTLAGTPLDAIAMFLGVALLALVVALDARRRLRRRGA